MTFMGCSSEPNSKVVGDLQRLGITWFMPSRSVGIVPNRYSRHKVSGANTVRQGLSEESEISSEKDLFPGLNSLYWGLSSNP